MHYEFCPSKAFSLLDVRRIGRVDAHDLVQFLREHYVAADLEDARAIVREYDADLDLALSYHEFSQLVLPAANSGLRAIAEQRRYGCHYCAGAPLPYDCVNLLVRLCEKEIALQRHRNESKRQLLACPDFVKVRTFNELSRGFHSVCVPDLLRFCETHGFFPRREDVEAILRRVDHDANQLISYDEFCELTQVQDATASPASPLKQPSPPATEESKEAAVASPAKKLDLSESEKVTLKKSSPAACLSPEQREAKEKSRADVQARIDNERARLDAEAEERRKAAAEAAAKREQELKEERERREAEAALKQKEREAELEKLREEREARLAEERAEREKRLAEAKAEREKREAELKKEMEERRARLEAEEAARAEALKAEQIENSMFLRFLKQLMAVERQNESLREMLFCHKAFSVTEAFRALDFDGSGTIEAGELADAFVKADCPMDAALAEKVIAAIDRDDDGSVDVREFAAAVTPLDASYRHPAHVGPLSFEQKYLYTQAWMAQLFELLEGLV